MTGYLDSVYDANTPDETRAIYDAWAASYEAEISENGYATPGRCAAALAQCMADKSTPVLDFGCGTGLSGVALRLAGFSRIDGCDLSPEMLAIAEAKTAYRTLTRIGATDPVPQGYHAIAAIGVIGKGAAPIEALDRILAALDQGGQMVFSLNDHSLEDPEITQKVKGYLSSGQAREIFYDYGAHLPGIGINSAVYVLEKL